MSKIKYISLCTAMLLCMILFTSCGGGNTAAGQDNRRAEGKESSVGQESRRAEGKESSAGQENRKTEGKESSAGQENRKTEGKESFAGQKNRKTEGEEPAAGGRRPSAFWQRWKWRERVYGINSSAEQEQEALPYPKVAVLPMDLRNCEILFSEECYCIYDGSLYGFFTAEGEEISPFIYEEAAPFSEGLACVRINGKYGFIGKDGTTVLPFIYDQAAPFTDGLAYFCIGEEYGFMDHEGRAVLGPDCDSVSSFWEERAYFSVDGLYGYLDTEGRIVAEPIYEDAGHFQDGLARVMRSGKYGLIGRDGKEILSPEYDSIRETSDGFLIAEKEGLKYCFDKSGSQCLEEGWNSIYEENGFFTAQRGGLTYCFDETGSQCLEEGWDWISVRDGMFVVGRDGKCGLIAWDGTVLFEPKYDSLWPAPERELVIMEIDGFYGVVDYEGKTKVPFAYRSISCNDDGGGLKLLMAGEYGTTRRYLVFSEENVCTESPLVFDSIFSFVGDRAVVELDGQYGVIRKDGTLEVSVRYDRIFLLQNGYIGLRAGNILALIDNSGRLIASGLYDKISEVNGCYLIQKDSKYGFLNERGEQVVAPKCVLIDRSIYGTSALCMIRCNGQQIESVLISTEEEEEKSRLIQKSLFQNHITPRAREYLEFLQDGAFSVEVWNGSEHKVRFSDFRAYRRLSKLYRIGDELVLCFFAEPTPASIHRSESGFFALRDGKVEALATGYEDGGIDGRRVCFWYDRKEAERKLGMREQWEDEYETDTDRFIYELGAEGAELSVHSRETWYWVGSSYTEHEEQEQAENPDERNSDSDAEESDLDVYIWVYTINGEEVSREDYDKMWERYHCLEVLDLNF